MVKWKRAHRRLRRATGKEVFMIFNNYFVILLLFFLSFFNLQFPLARAFVTIFLFYFCVTTESVFLCLCRSLSSLSSSSAECERLSTRVRSVESKFRSVRASSKMTTRTFLSIGNNCVLFLSGLSRFMMRKTKRKSRQEICCFAVFPLHPSCHRLSSIFSLLFETIQIYLEL